MRRVLFLAVALMIGVSAFGQLGLGIKGGFYVFNPRREV